ncbi:hypothetical protein [Paracoccus tegillarcae]|uniref:Uncharacterized protein n=1 Tax=Paracoccus tegillarcae TaxID=1529068 RepID=A0A2K9EHL7_9RHOB|nr:hypothetical protein [Paracoccus tegillarcae]AUH33829.1 hypothetical protein CUV01_10895 [Paracoccus tegillarcae]
MKSAILIAAAFAASATAALADVTPGKAQFAAGVGVNAADYSLAELALLRDAKRDNDREAVNYYVTRENRTGVQSAAAVTPAETLLAAKLGLDASRYTQAELDLIDIARRDNDREKEAFYLNHENRQSASTAAAVTPAEAQVAAKLGLDAGRYTLVELNQIDAARRDNNREKENFYLNHVNRNS